MAILFAVLWTLPFVITLWLLRFVFFLVRLMFRALSPPAPNRRGAW